MACLFQASLSVQPGSRNEKGRVQLDSDQRASSWYAPRIGLLISPSHPAAYLVLDIRRYRAPGAPGKLPQNLVRAYTGSPCAAQGLPRDSEQHADFPAHPFAVPSQAASRPGEGQKKTTSKFGCTMSAGGSWLAASSGPGARHRGRPSRVLPVPVTRKPGFPFRGEPRLRAAQRNETPAEENPDERLPQLFEGFLGGQGGTRERARAGSPFRLIR